MKSNKRYTSNYNFGSPSQCVHQIFHSYLNVHFVVLHCLVKVAIHVRPDTALLPLKSDKS